MYPSVTVEYRDGSTDQITDVQNIAFTTPGSVVFRVLGAKPRVIDADPVYKIVVYKR